MRGFHFGKRPHQVGKIFSPVLKLFLILVTVMMNCLLSPTFGPGTYWKEKSVSICKSSEVHRKVINIVVTLSPAGPRKEIMNDVAIWKQETLLTTVGQRLPKNAEPEQA